MSKQKGSRDTLSTVFDWVSSAITALVVVALLFTFVCRVVSVDGYSMTNTLQHGDRLLIGSSFYTPDYGDVVVVARQEDAPLIKRVIGLPGDRIRIGAEDHIVYRNGQPLLEDYIREKTKGTPTNGMTEEIVVPEGKVFVLGDNRGDSLDSRILGPVSQDDILGKALFRLMPDPIKITNGE